MLSLLIYSLVFPSRSTWQGLVSWGPNSPSSCFLSCFFALGKGELALPITSGWTSGTGAARADSTRLLNSPWPACQKCKQRASVTGSRPEPAGIPTGIWPPAGVTGSVRQRSLPTVYESSRKQECAHTFTYRYRLFNNNWILLWHYCEPCFPIFTKV